MGKLEYGKAYTLCLNSEEDHKPFIAVYIGASRFLTGSSKYPIIYECQSVAHNETPKGRLIVKGIREKRINKKEKGLVEKILKERGL